MKIAFLNDTHCGIRNSSDVFLKNHEDFYGKVFFPYLLENNITQIIHLGDYYDHRKFINFKAQNANRQMFLNVLKEEGIQGLVLDLRNNGGGSLPTVVEMAGLFIKEGPIVQVRSTGEAKEVLEDRDKSIAWDGPLVILVNEISASASEILAAAMQDYKRAIVIGSKQTYGKGTVQNVINLLNDGYYSAGKSGPPQPVA